ncbi:MAG: class I SAM-dependent RNA methyltransferase [Bacteroidales bacterium]|jgi:putative N6-adenine-specific DNA methylase
MKFIAKTLYGLEKVVAGELKELGATGITVDNRAVFFSGELPVLYTANYMSRTALSFLYEVSSFRIRSADDLYNGIQKIGWDRYMDSDDTFSIVPVVNSEIFNHTGFAALKAKDAIADYFRNRSGKRPSVNTSDPDILINLHISHNTVTVSLDSSVIPLFKRGYRGETLAAPLNEVLAAGMLMLSGWKADADIIDPMCGSGTIAIEAGLMACRIPPGRFRRSFGFQRWKDYDERLFEAIKERYDGRISGSPSCRISCSDISPEAVNTAIINIRNAGLEGVIHPSEMDFRDLKSDSQGGLIFINPPYGERMSQGETNEIYGMIGTTLKHKFTGFTAWIISSNRESLKFIGLKPAAKHVLFNGALECLFERFDMYGGSRRHSNS